jgi:hypothetical protein
VVEAPDDRDIALDVGEVINVQRSGDGWSLQLAQRPDDLSFLTDLPGDVISSLDLSNVVPKTVESIVSVAPGLRRLCLGFTGFNDGILYYVAQLSALTSLYTFGNRFTDAGVQQLASLRRLRNLSLEEETLTVAAFDFVDQLPNLIRLDVWDVQMTEDEHLALKARLPNIEVGPWGSGP